jgi:hypothetical protein
VCLRVRASPLRTLHTIKGSSVHSHRATSVGAVRRSCIHPVGTQLSHLGRMPSLRRARSGRGQKLQKSTQVEASGGADSGNDPCRVQRSLPNQLLLPLLSKVISRSQFRQYQALRISGNLPSIPMFPSRNRRMLRICGPARRGGQSTRWRSSPTFMGGWSGNSSSRRREM